MERPAKVWTRRLVCKPGLQVQLQTVPRGYRPATGFEPPQLELVLPALPLDYGGVRAGVHRQIRYTKKGSAARLDLGMDYGCSWMKLDCLKK